MIPSNRAGQNGACRPQGPGLPARVRHFLASHTDEGVLLGLAAFLMLVATNTQTGWLYVVVALIVAVLLVGFLGPRSTLSGLEVHRRLPGPASVGEEVRVVIEVRNPGRRTRLLVALEETLPDSLPGSPRVHRFVVERVSPGGSARVSYRLPCTLRGYHAFPQVRLRSGTPLGLFMHERLVEAGSGELVVYPRGPRLPRSPMYGAALRRTFRARTCARAGSSVDFRGLRAYSEGEDIRFVHWPATARTGQMMIREFRDVGGQSLAVLVENGQGTDYGRGPDSTLEAAVAAAASLADLARRSGLPLTVMSEWGGRLVRRQGNSGEQVMDFLARIRGDGRMDWQERLREASRFLPPDSHLFILAARPILDPVVLGPVLGRRGRVTVVQFCAPTYHTNGRPLLEDMTREHYTLSERALAGWGVEVRTHGRGEDLVRTLQGGVRR